MKENVNMYVIKWSFIEEIFDAKTHEEARRKATKQLIDRIGEKNFRIIKRLANEFSAKRYGVRKTSLFNYRGKEQNRQRGICSKGKICKECGSKIVCIPEVHMHRNLCAKCSEKYK